MTNAPSLRSKRISLQRCLDGKRMTLPLSGRSLTTGVLKAAIVALSMAAVVGGIMSEAKAATYTNTNSGSTTGSAWTNGTFTTYPGTTNNVTNNTDMAVFQNLSNWTVNFTANLNLQSIQFAATASNVTIGAINGGTLLLTTGGSIDNSKISTNTGVTNTINAPIAFVGGPGTYTITGYNAGNSVGASRTVLNGSITSSNAGVTTLIFNAGGVNGLTIVNGAITDTSGNMINLVVTSGANNYFGTASVAQTNAGTYFTSNNTVNAINVGASALGGGNNAANMILSGSNNVRNGVTIGTATNIVGLQNNTLIVTGANGYLISTNGVMVGTKGYLVYDNATSNVTNRLGTATITLNGGTFGWNATNTGLATAANVQQLILGGGFQSGLTDTAPATGNNTLAIGSISGGGVNGATLYTTLANATLNSGRVILSTAPALTGGILPWAVDSTGAFLTYSNNGGTNYLGAYGSISNNSYQTLATLQSTDNVKVTNSTNATLAASGSVNSLTLAQTSAITLNLGGFSLTNVSGGILSTGNFASVITNGTITAGTGGATNLYLWNNGTVAQTIGATIADNGGALTLVKAGSGTTTLSSNNTYTGQTLVESGTLVLTNSGSVSSGGVFISPSATFADYATNVSIANILINSGGTLATYGTGTISNVTNNGTMTIGSSPGLLVIKGITNNGGSLNPSTAGYTNGTGQINFANTNNASNSYGGLGDVLIFNGGSAFDKFSQTNNSFATFAMSGTGTVTIGSYMQATNATNSQNTFSGGNWVLGNVGANSSGAQVSGTNLITSNAAVTLATGQAWLHGIWIAQGGGTLTSPGAISEINGNDTIPLQLIVNTFGVLSVNGTVGLGKTSGSFSNSTALPHLLTVNGGVATMTGLILGNNGGGSYAMTNDTSLVTVTNGGTLNVNGNVTLEANSSGVQSNDTNTLSFAGGALNITGTLGVGTNSGVANSFVWTGGTLSVWTVTATNSTWNGAASSIFNNTLNNTNAGTLLVGNSTNGYAGKTIITGNYTASGSATTTFNIFGTNQSTSWVGGSSNYSYLTVSGTALYGGTMALNMTGYDLATNASTTLTLATNSFSGSSLTNVILKATTTNGISGSYATGGFTNFSFLNTNGYTAYLLKSSATNLTFSTAINNWVGGGNWGTGGSSVWSLGIDPNSTKAVAFFGTGSNTNVTLDQNRIVGGLIFTNNASGYSISGNGSSTLTLDGSSFGGKAMVQNQLGNQTIAAPMVLNTTAEVTNSGAQTVTLSGAISGNGGLQIDSNGVTVLTGADTASGQNTVNAGAVLTVTNAGSLSSGALAVNGSLNLASSTSSTPGLLTGNGAINQSGAGTLTLASGNNTFSGTDALKSGGLVIGSGSSLTGATITQTGGTLSVSGTAGNVTASGGTLTGSGTLGALTVNAGATVAPGGANASTAANLTVSSLVLNGGIFNLNVFSGSSIDTITSTGAVTFSSGTVDLALLTNASSSGWDQTVSTNYTLFSGANNTAGTFSASNFNFNGSSTVAGTWSVTTNATSLILVYTANSTAITVTSTSGTLSESADSSQSTPFSGSTAPLQKLGAGEYVLDLGNSYGGATYIAAGTLTVATNGALGTSSTVYLGTSTNNTASGSNSVIQVSNADQTIAAGVAVASGSAQYAVQNSSGGTVTFTGGLTLNTNLTVANTSGGNLVVNSSILGAGVLTVNPGSGTVTLSSANTYSNGTVLSGGTLAVSNNAALGTGSLSVATNATVQAAGNSALTNSVAIAGANTLTLDANGNALSVGAISGSGASLYAHSSTGAGTLTLSGSNSYTGASTVNSGTLALGSANALPSATMLTVNGTGVLNENGYNATVATLSDGGVSTGTITNSGAASTLTVNGSSASSFSGTITGALGLTKSGAGTLTLGGADSYTGATLVNAGVLVVNGSLSNTAITVTNATFTESASGSVNGTSSLAVQSNGTVALSGINGLSGNTAVLGGGQLSLLTGSTLGSSSISNAGYLVVNRNDYFLLTNAVTGSGSITYSGTGTTVVSGTNNNITTANVYLTGGTLVNGASTNNAIIRSGTFTMTGGILDLAGNNFGNQSGIVITDGGSSNGIVTNSVAGSTANFQDTQNINTTFGGTFAANSSGVGNIQLMKQGTGTLALTGSGVLNNIYFNAAAGTVRLNGGNYTVWGTGTGSTNSLVELSSGTLTYASTNNNGYGVTSGNNWLIDGGTMNIGTTVYNGSTNALQRFSMTAGGQTFTLNSGSVIVNNATYGVRMGNQNGSANAAAGMTITMVQNGGLFNLIGNGGVVGGFTLGTAGTNNAYQDTYTLGGGTLSIDAVNNGANSGGSLSLGADTAGAGTTTFYLNGGVLAVNGTVNGSQGAGAKQAFVWNGGQLSVGTFNATQLSSANGSTNFGTLSNTAGVLAAGGLGVAGKTAITGNYVQSGTGALAIDLNGSAAATNYQSFPGSFYDTVAVSSNATLGGDLLLSIGNGFAPASNNSFSVLTASNVTGMINGAHTSLVNGATKVVATDGLSIFTATNTGTALNLTNYTVNQYAGGVWGSGGASSWTAVDPNSGVYTAYFGTNGGSGSVVMDQNRMVSALIFSNAVASSLTASGGAVLTLTNNAGVTTNASLTVIAGGLTLNTPVNLQSGLVISDTAGTSVDVKGNISESVTGSGVTIASNNTGLVTFYGTNSYTGATVVNGGYLDLTGTNALAAANLNSNKLSVGTGATLIFGVGGSNAYSSAQINAALASGAFKSGSGIGYDATGTNFTLSSLGAVSSLTLAGSGTSTVNQNNSSLMGGITLLGGALAVDPSTATTNALGGGNNTITLNGTAPMKLDLGGTSQTVAAVVNNNAFAGLLTLTNGTLTFGADWSMSVFGSLNEATNASINQSNALVFLNAYGSSYSAAPGATTTLAGSNNVYYFYSEGGSLALNNNFALGSGALYLSGATTLTSGTGFTNASGNTIDFSGTPSLTVGGSLDFGAAVVNAGTTTLTLQSGSSLVMTNGLNGVGTLTVTGSGSLTLGGTNTTWGTVINGGSVLAQGSNSLGVNLVLSSGLLDLGGNTDTFATVGFYGTNYTVTNGAFTVTSGYTASNTTVAQSLTGGATFTSLGGNVYLTNANTYTGATLVTGGTLYSSYNAGTTYTATNAGSTFVAGVAIDPNWTAAGVGSVTLNAGTVLAIDATGMNFALTSSLTNGTNATLGTYGTGTVTLADPNTNYSAVSALAITGGTLDLGGVTLAVTNATFTSGTLQNGTINVSSLTASNSTAVVNANITGSASLTKVGTGTLTLGGANTYTNATTIFGGGLVLNGSLSNSTVTVSNNATFIEGATGTITGTKTLTVTNGTAVIGGANTYTGATTVNSNGVLSFNTTGLGTQQSSITVNSGGSLYFTNSGSVTTLTNYITGYTTNATNGLVTTNYSTATLTLNAGSTALIANGATLNIGSANNAYYITINGTTLAVGSGGTLNAGAVGAGKAYAINGGGTLSIASGGTAIFGMYDNNLGTSGGGTNLITNAGTASINGLSSGGGLGNGATGLNEIANTGVMTNGIVQFGTASAPTATNILVNFGSGKLVGQSLSLGRAANSGVNEFINYGNATEGSIYIGDNGLTNTGSFNVVTNTGTLIVNSTGTTLAVGNGGTNNLLYNSGMLSNSGNFQIGYSSNANGMNLVTNATGGTIYQSGSLTLGNYADTATNQLVNNGSMFLAANLTVGSGGQVNTVYNTGTLSNSASLQIGWSTNASGLNTVTNTASGNMTTWQVQIGNGSAGTNIFYNAGTLTYNGAGGTSINIGQNIYSTGLNEIILAGGIWTNSNSNGVSAWMNLGNSAAQTGTNIFALSNGGQYIGGNTNSGNWRYISIGNQGSQVNILTNNGGLVTNLQNIYVGNGSSNNANTVYVGSGTITTVGGNSSSGITVGNAGQNATNTVTVDAGGVVSGNNLNLGVAGTNNLNTVQLNNGGQATMSTVTLGAASAANSSGGTNIINVNSGSILSAKQFAAGAGSVAAGSVNQINLNGGTLLAASGANTNFLGAGVANVAITGNGTLNDNGQAVTVGATIADGTATGQLIKSGTGTLTLSGNNTYSAGTLLSAGGVNITSGSALGSGNLTMAGGTTLGYTGSGNSTLANNINLSSGNGTIANTSGSALTLSGNLSDNGSLLTFAKGSYNVSGNISGNYALSNAAVTLSGLNAYSAPTSIFAGSSLNLGAHGSLAGASVLNLGATTDSSTTTNTFNLGGFNQSLASIGSTGSGYNQVINSGPFSTLTLTGTSTFGGSFNGANIGLTIAGGNVTLTGTSAYTGTTTVNGGSLNLANTAFLTATSNVVVQNGGSLLLGGTSANQIHADTPITMNGGTLSMGGNGTNRAVAQTFSSLTLTGNSVIDFANLSGNSSLTFGDIIMNGNSLAIYNWSGTNQYGTQSGTQVGTFTHLYDLNSGGLSSQDLSNISFYSGGLGTTFLGNAAFSGNEIVPVPEPGVIVAAVLLLGWMIFSNRGLLLAVVARRRA